MQIIGTRPHSGFRAGPEFYIHNHHYHPGIDPHTGGPVAVVDDWTDDVREDYMVDTDPQSPTFRHVRPRPGKIAKKGG